MENKEQYTLLKKQHRNTRHDAVDKIEEIYSRYEDEYGKSSFLFSEVVQNMMNEITGAVFNLKQRFPEEVGNVVPDCTVKRSVS